MLRAILQVVDSLLVVLLIVLWVAVFLPSRLRARFESSPISSVGTFRRGMRALSSGDITSRQGRWVVMPRSREDEITLRQRMRERQRRILVVLIWTAIGTGLIGILPWSRNVLWFHAVVDVLLAAYVGVLLWLKNSSTSSEAAAPVVYEEAEPELPRAEHF